MRTVAISVLLLVSLAGCQTEPQKSDTPSDSASARKGNNMIDGSSKANAEARNGNSGTQSPPLSGVNQIGVDPSLAVKGTPWGDYTRNMTDSINHRWQELSEKLQAVGINGKVVLSFRLHSDGKVSDIKIKRNDVSDLLGNICVEALIDPSPYQMWTPEMRRALAAEFADLEYTFSYETY